MTDQRMLGGKVHWAYERRKCTCGDSYCSDDYQTEEVIACGARTHPHERTPRLTGVTCSKCCASLAYREQQAVELRAARQKTPYEKLVEENKRLRAQIAAKETEMNTRCAACGRVKHKCTCSDGDCG